MMKKDINKDGSIFLSFRKQITSLTLKNNLRILRRLKIRKFKNIKEAQTKVRYPYKRNEYSMLEAWHLIHAVLSSLFHRLLTFKI